MSSFFWTMFYSPDQSSDIDEYIRSDNLEAILAYDKLSAELQQTSNSLHSYLSKQDTIMRLIAYAYDPEESKRQLSAAANDVFVADISALLDTITSNPALMGQLFMALRPYSTEQHRYLTHEELDSVMIERVSVTAPTTGPAGLPQRYAQRRIPLHVAENFCRLIIMLVRSPMRLKKLQQYILNNPYILSLFCQILCSAPATEAIHYLIVGKDRATESIHLQTEIVLQSGIVQSMFALFEANAPFDSLMHASFIICSLLANGCTGPVRELILDSLPALLRSTINLKSHPGTIRTLLQITVSAFREAIRSGILSEKESESLYYANKIDELAKACIPGFLEILHCTPNIPKPPPGSPPHLLCEVPLVTTEACDAGMKMLLKQHVISALAELLRLSEITKEAIKEKEERTLQTEFRPDMAVDFVELHYRAAGAGEQKQLLPFVIGLSYIFQDVYQHLKATCGYEFTSEVAKACSDANASVANNVQSLKKTISIQHTLGPDGEIVFGSSPYLTLLLLESGAPALALAEMFKFPEQSIIHYPCSIIATQVLEYQHYAPRISLHLFDGPFFALVRRALLEEDGLPEGTDLGKAATVCEVRLKVPTRRTSLDAHVEMIIAQLHRAAYGFKEADKTNPPFKALASLLEGSPDAVFLLSTLSLSLKDETSTF